MPSLRRFFAHAGLAAVVAAVALMPHGRPAVAQPPGDRPELRYVPPDAAVFVHLDLAKLWAGPLGRQVRDSRKAEFEALAPQLQRLLGVAPDDVRSVTAFWPRFQTPEDATRFAAVVAFAKPIDREKAAAAAKLLPAVPGQPPMVSLSTPTDRLAVIRVRLAADDVTEQKAHVAGPLAGALRESAGGHVVTIGANLAGWANDLRNPEGVPGAAAVLAGESLTATLDHGTDLTLTLKTKGAARAGAGFAALAAAAEAGLTRWAKETEAEGPDLYEKDLVAVAKALAAAMKGMKVEAGPDPAATVRLPANLPLPGAVTALGRVVNTGGGFGGGDPSNNLKQIGIAMHNYHDVYNMFPAAAVCDKQGKPLLSWRVTILPYLEQDGVYKQFKMDEPWDSAHNKKLLAQMPPVYALPGTSRPGATSTYFRVFVGNGAGFDLDKGSKIASITDGTSNTLMVATAADAVLWTKPDELNFDPEQDQNAYLGYKHPSGCWVALFDGSVRRLRKRPDRDTLHAAITRSGGEVLQLP